MLDCKELEARIVVVVRTTPDFAASNSQGSGLGLGTVEDDMVRHRDAPVEDNWVAERSPSLYH